MSARTAQDDTRRHPAINGKIGAWLDPCPLGHVNAGDCCLDAAHPGPCLLIDRPDARSVCGCGHQRLAHVGRPNRSHWVNGCAVMICGCELFRGEWDR